MNIFCIMLGVLLFCNGLHAVSSKSASDIIPIVQSPLVKELDPAAIKKKLETEKKNRALLQFMLGVAYFKNDKYSEAYKTLNSVPKIQYLDDYIKYYRSVSALKYFGNADGLKKNLDDLYTLLNNGNGGLSEDVKGLIPEFEFKTALAMAGAKNYASSLDYYSRARTKGYSDLRAEFDLIRSYVGYNKELGLSLMLDLNRRFNPADAKKLFDTLPEKTRTELYALSGFNGNGKTAYGQMDYRKSESDLIASIKDAVAAKDAASVSKLSEEYLKSYPQGSYGKRFYELTYGFIEGSIISRDHNVSYYESVLKYYDRNYLDKLAVKLFQKVDLDEVQDLLEILLTKYPQYDRGLYLMATLSEDKGDNSRALEYYKEIVGGFPQSQFYQRSLFKYAWLEMVDGGYSDCVDLFTRYIDEGKDIFDWSVTAALYFKAQCLDKRSRHDDAKTVRQELIARFPYSFYSLISMEEEGISLSDHIKANIKPLDTSAEAISPQELKSIRTAIMLVRAGLVDSAAKELASVNLDRLSPGYIDVVTSIYKYSSNPDLTIMAAGKLMSSLKGYASQEHAETHFPKLYFDSVKRISENNNVPPFIILAIMKRESAFKKDAVSSAGAIGLMQMLPDTAHTVDPKMKAKSLTEPDSNIKVASAYIKSLIQKYDGNFIYVLSSYNAGDDALTRWLNWYGKKYDNVEFIENIPYLETRNYVKAVLSNYYMYNALYEKKDVKFSQILKIEVPEKTETPQNVEAPVTTQTPQEAAVQQEPAKQ
jgi:soluble lytic murein transglycosylase-like protein